MFESIVGMGSVLGQFVGGLAFQVGLTASYLVCAYAGIAVSLLQSALCLSDRRANASPKT